MSYKKFDDISYDNMAEVLIEVVPELLKEYEAEREWWRDVLPPPHVIYGDLLNPYIAVMLGAGEQEEILRRIFGLVETLAKHEDRRVRDVVAVTVCEYLGGNKGLLAQARKYMGPSTRRLSWDIQAFWGRDDPDAVWWQIVARRLRRFRLWLIHRRGGRLFRHDETGSKPHRPESR